MDFSDLTLGVEEEYQIIDGDTRELTSYVGDVLEQGAVIFRDQVKPELLQSQVEIGSHVCRNIREARQEVTRLSQSSVGGEQVAGHQGRSGWASP